MSNMEDDAMGDGKAEERSYSTRGSEEMVSSNLVTFYQSSGDDTTDVDQNEEEVDSFRESLVGRPSFLLPQDHPEDDNAEVANSANKQEEAKQEVTETQSFRPNVSATSFAASVDPTTCVRVGTFKINGEVKHYAIVPPLKINSQPELQRLMNYWGVPRPNFLIQANQSNHQRDYTISEENAPFILDKVFHENKDPVFKRAPAKRNLKMSIMAMSLSRPWSAGNVTGQDNTDSTEAPMADSGNEWRWINRYLERCCIQALSSVVAAADMTNGWIFCHGSPGSNEKLLEGAMDITGAAPYVIVVDDIHRYHLSAERQAFVDQMFDSASCVPIYEAEQGHHGPTGEDIDFTFDDEFDVLYKRGSYPVPHSSSSSLWERAPEGKWKPAFPWKKGTHFIFSEKFEDFQPRVLGPAGYLCIHGCNEDYEANPKRTGYMIREAILTVKPCLLFDNTGGETQMYARLIREIQKRDRDSVMDRRGQMRRQATATRRLSVFTGNMEAKPLDKSSKSDCHYKDLKIKLRRQAGSLRDIANQGQTSGDAIAVNLGLADVVQIVDLYCANPRLFSMIIVTVDPLNESPEEIVKKMTLSFARALSESREVGAGDADKNAVEQAWRFHYQLEISEFRPLRMEMFTTIA